jgi:hypothetical protein
MFVCCGKSESGPPDQHMQAVIAFFPSSTEIFRSRRWSRPGRNVSPLVEPWITAVTSELYGQKRAQGTYLSFVSRVAGTQRFLNILSDFFDTPVRNNAADSSSVLSQLFGAEMMAYSRNYVHVLRSHQSSVGGSGMHISSCQRHLTCINTSSI